MVIDGEGGKHNGFNVVLTISSVEDDRYFQAHSKTRGLWFPAPPEEGWKRIKEGEKAVTLPKLLKFQTVRVNRPNTEIRPFRVWA